MKMFYMPFVWVFWGLAFLISFGNWKPWKRKLKSGLSERMYITSIALAPFVTEKQFHKDFVAIWGKDSEKLFAYLDPATEEISSLKVFNWGCDFEREEWPGCFTEDLLITMLTRTGCCGKLDSFNLPVFDYQLEALESCQSIITQKQADVTDQIYSYLAKIKRRQDIIPRLKQAIKMIGDDECPNCSANLLDQLDLDEEHCKRCHYSFEEELEDFEVEDDEAA